MSDFWNLPDGVEEIVPPLSTNLEKTKTELLDYFQNKGFDLIFTPLVEYSDFIGGLANEELSRSSFQFSDTNSERSLSLRPDISQQVARIDRRFLTEKNKKYCYYGEVTKKPLGSFTKAISTVKVGLEIFYDSETGVKEDIFNALSGALKKLGLKDYVLTIGDISILDEILDKLRFPLDKRNKLKDILSSRSKSDLSEFLKQEGKGKRTLSILSKLLDIIGDYEQEFKNLNLICRELKIDPKKLKNIKQSFDILKKNRIKNVLIDMVDFPGYSYHSGIVFSIFQPKTGVPLINGGQYKTPFSKANKKERKGMGFDIDLISILKLQSK